MFADGFVTTVIRLHGAHRMVTIPRLNARKPDSVGVAI